MSSTHTGRISRRATLQWVAAVAAASGISSGTFAGSHSNFGRALARGYGTDPDLLRPSVPWPRIMNAQQLRATEMLADMILPGTETAPPPSALGIAEFVDEWVSAPYPEQQADRSVIFEGLAWIDAEAGRRWQRDFLKLQPSQQEQLIEAMVPKDIKDLANPEERFFHRLRFVIVGAYYTTPEGFDDIGYIGNVALPSYPPVTGAEKEILDAELRKLGVNGGR